MILIDENLALTEFARLARPDECPALGVEEQIDILARFKRASLWVASTATDLGAVVIPTLANRNGHRYQAVEYVTGGQNTGATEPSWSTSRDARITDGNVVWEEVGTDWGARLWDIHAAACEAWTVKAGKSSPTSDVETDALSIRSSQLFDHCVSMSDRFRSVSCA